MIIIDGDVVNATANYKNDNCKMFIDLARDLIRMREKHGG